MNIITKGKFAVTKEEIAELFRPTYNPEAKVKRKLWLIGIFVAPIVLAGMLVGFARAYNRSSKEKKQSPELANLTPIARVSMIVFGVLFFILYWSLFYCLYLFIKELSNPYGTSVSIYSYAIIASSIIGFFWCVFIFRKFTDWQTGIHNMLLEGKKFGTARFAYESELKPYAFQDGLYIGGGYAFSGKGHALTCAGTRGGKGTNLIIPNLLDAGGYKGSWCIIDPKGENAAIAARYQRESGRKVIILNPWDLLADNIGEAQTYNPLDILVDKESIHLVDDINIISEMLIPIDQNEKDAFFTDNARSIVSGLLLHLMISSKREEQTLATLWRWVRLSGGEWNSLIADMYVSDDVQYGLTLKNAASEIKKLMEAGDRTFGSIITTALQCTDFLKSPALQKALKSGFNPQELADGNTTLFIVIPADKLKSHFRWLRLVVTSTMRAIVRKPNKRVTFLLDEFAALGYLPEIETALSTYAGFEISVWAIVQSLIQLKKIYGDNWETFTANCTIRHFFTVNDNFTAEYVSKAIGQASHVTYTRNWFGIKDSQSNKRDLVTPDELRRGSGDNIFTFISAYPVTYFPKLPYYQMGSLSPDGKNRYDENPYMKNEDNKPGI